jgi:cytidylate kinase
MSSLPPRWKIAIDGPAAGGKTTVARRVAQRLGLTVIDTGAMYRAVTWAALRTGIELHDEASLEALAERQSAEYSFADNGDSLLVAGENITPQLHDEQVSRAVPMVASLPAVRRVLAAAQRRLGLAGGVVMTGRDIGTVVLPEAELKIYLTASAAERARRRCLDLQARHASYDAAAVLAAIEERDRQDSERLDSPLRQADDAAVVDSTDIDLEGVVDRIVQLAQARAQQITA